ncbi:MAG: hypothetical protein H0V97_04815 [Actinobacteria bacterium]|nr:hypothetical protein [Actinomycetota bacterium]
MSDDASDNRNFSHARQMIGSLVAAVLIVIVVIALVTANLGPGDSDRNGDDETRYEEDNSGPGSSDGGPDRRLLPT